MPRQSYRAKALAKIVRTCECAHTSFVVDQLLDSDGEDESLDVESTSFLPYLHCRDKLDMAKQARYFVKRKVRKSPMTIFEDDLKEEDDGLQ